MKNTIFLFFILLLPFVQSCSHGHGEVTDVATDNGKLWKANPETTTGIANMQSILTNYEGKEMNHEMRIQLRKELESEFQNIFKQCTMKGEAHNQLHNYLFPMKELFEHIDSDEAGASEKAIKGLKKRLSTYKNYFE